LGAVLQAPRPIFWKIFYVFKSACLTPKLNGKRNKKGESTLFHWIPIINDYDPAQTLEIINSLHNPVRREMAKKNIEDHQNSSPKQWIFWPNIG
jgi:hypothetical protein